MLFSFLSFTSFFFTTRERIISQWQEDTWPDIGQIKRPDHLSSGKCHASKCNQVLLNVGPWCIGWLPKKDMHNFVGSEVWKLKSLPCSILLLLSSYALHLEPAFLLSMSHALDRWCKENGDRIIYMEDLVNPSWDLFYVWTVHMGSKVGSTVRLGSS